MAATVRWNSLQNITPRDSIKKTRFPNTRFSPAYSANKISLFILKSSLIVLVSVHVFSRPDGSIFGIQIFPTGWLSWLQRVAVWLCASAILPTVISAMILNSSIENSGGGTRGTSVIDDAFEKRKLTGQEPVRAQDEVITPPARVGAPLKGLESAHRDGDTYMHSPVVVRSRRLAISSQYSSSGATPEKGMTTPEQMEQILSDFGAAADAAAQPYTRDISSGGGPAGGSFLSLHQSALVDSMMQASNMNTYRPSAVPKGVVTTPLRSDGSIVSSLLTERERVLAELGIDEEILEKSIETLREWIACRVLQPLEKAISVAHSNVIHTAASIDLKNVRLTDLNDFGVEPSSRLADDTHTLHQLHSAVVQAMSNPMNASDPRYQKCLTAILAYHNLLLLLRGEFLAGSLLPPAPDGYILKRIKELANGTCMKDFMWNSGGESATTSKPWNNELPTDSALILYLFASFLSAPFWQFADKDQSKVEGPSDVLYLGRLPPRVSGKFTAIVPTRLPKGSKGTSVQGLQLGTSNPHFSVSVGGVVKLTETGQLAMFRALVIFLFYVDQDNSVLGNCSLQHLHLDTVVDKKKKFHFIDSLRRLHLW